MENYIYFVGGMLAVYIAQFLHKHVSRIVKIREGLRWECKAKGCYTSAEGPEQMVSYLKDVHLESTPEHREANL